MTSRPELKFFIDTLFGHPVLETGLHSFLEVVS